MAEYIDREAAIRALTLHDCDSAGAKMAICDLHAADVAPVRHGHWIYHPDDLFPNDSTQECSYCHAEESLTLYNENYCPSCGTKMDEVNE